MGFISGSQLVLSRIAMLEMTADFRHRSIKGFWLLLKNCQSLLEDPKGRVRKLSVILYKRQEKAMEKTIAKLCLMLAMLHLLSNADGLAIKSKGRLKSRPREKLVIIS